MLKKPFSNRKMKKWLFLIIIISIFCKIKVGRFAGNGNGMKMILVLPA